MKVKTTNGDFVIDEMKLHIWLENETMDGDEILVIKTSQGATALLLKRTNTVYLVGVDGN